MRLLGYWKSSLTDSYALPQHFEAPLDPAVRERLVVYLNAGHMVNQSRGHSSCRYGCGNNGSAERTDGEWVWPEGLSHYVEVHNVALPREFIDHVSSRESCPRPPETIGSHVQGDEQDWLRWSDERMPVVFKTALENAIATAERCFAARIDAAARESETQHGLSDATCMQAGCKRRARRDRALCARCLMSADGTTESIRRECHEEQRVVLLQTSL